jgi:hypothetical protein
MFHGEQCGSCVGICSWSVSSRRLLSAPLTVCSQLKLLSSVFRHGVVYFGATCISLRDIGSAWKCRQKFRRKFRDERGPSRQTIHSLVNKLRSTGLLINQKQNHKRRVLINKKLDDTGTRLDHTPRYSLKRLAQGTGVSKSGARTATQLPKLNNCNPHFAAVRSS